jgi:hypothetical protein
MLGCLSAEVAIALTTELGVASLPEASWMFESCSGCCAGVGFGRASSGRFAGGVWGSESGMGAGGLICFGCKPMARIGADRFQSWAWAVSRMKDAGARVQAEAKSVFSAMEFSK